MGIDVRLIARAEGTLRRMIILLIFSGCSLTFDKIDGPRFWGNVYIGHVYVLGNWVLKFLF